MLKGFASCLTHAIYITEERYIIFHYIDRGRYSSRARRLLYCSLLFLFYFAGLFHKLTSPFYSLFIQIKRTILKAADHAGKLGHVVNLMNMYVFPIGQNKKYSFPKHWVVNPAGRDQPP